MHTTTTYIAVLGRDFNGHVAHMVGTQMQTRRSRPTLENWMKRHGQLSISPLLTLSSVMQEINSQPISLDAVGFIVLCSHSGA